MRRILLGVLLLAPVLAAAQFAPQAGLPGTTALHRMSGKISAWATACSIQRGLMHIAQPSLGYASLGDSTMAIGAADGGVVSLGDSGIAVVRFATPVADGPGNDIAVFENGFVNPSEGYEAFLETAFVEISSDGFSFFRFPALCTIQDTAQIPGAGVYTDARQLHNLAGKYASPYGVPFDFSELAGTPGLNLAAITHVRIVDVIGSIGAHASVDGTGRKINDPYPTAFPSGGFDLDAVAVLHGTNPDGIAETAALLPLRAYPNPASGVLYLQRTDQDASRLRVVLSDAVGRAVRTLEITTATSGIDLSSLPQGIYSMQVISTTGQTWQQRIAIR